MKKLSIISVCLLFANILVAQVWEDNLLKTNPSPTVQEKSDAFEAYRGGHIYTKGNGFKPYARKMNFLLERCSGNTAFNPTTLFVEWQKEQTKYTHAKEASTSNWVSKGPINTPIIMSNGKKRGNGRVNCIAFDPFDPDIIWIGSPAGGMWKTTDGGSNWTTATDNLPVIGVSHIAIDPTDTQVMYIVTGDADASDTYSIGIFLRKHFSFFK